MSRWIVGHKAIGGSLFLSVLDRGWAIAGRHVGSLFWVEEGRRVLFCRLSREECFCRLRCDPGNWGESC